ncbi:anti-sigma factor [Aquimarina sp. U1-2]|nr:anti-sigma factor [Aquimarina sp. U1-2]
MFIIAVAILAVSCSSDDGPPTSTLEVNALNVVTLQGSAIYQAWLRTNGNTISLGTFQDNSFPKTFSVLTEDLNNANEFFITIESSASNTPSNTRLASASFNGSSNTAQLSSLQTIGDFNGISGNFVLRTFTGATANGDPNGIWFTNTLNGSQTITPGLNLPQLSSGWSYEAWVVLQDRNGANLNVSLGKFSQANQSDTSDIFSGQTDGPSVPGEDFLNEAAGNLINIDVPVNLAGKSGFITIEPTTSDNSSEPFYIELLSFQNAQANELNGMNTNNFFITGSVRR